MRDLFKQMIRDQHATTTPPIKRRDNPFSPEHTQLNKALIYMGVRRSGKTFLMHQMMQDYLDNHHQLHSLVNINFEDERMTGMLPQDFNSIIEAHQELYPELSGEPIIFFFDEIQEIDGWEKFIRRLIEGQKHHVYITGSSAKLLSKEIASSLRGRSLAKEVFPLSFTEHLTWKNITLEKNPPTSKARANYRHAMAEYFAWGGFPEIFDYSIPLKREIIQSYIQAILFRDVIERHRITNVSALKHFVAILLNQTGSLLSIQKIYNTLVSLGIQVSKNTCHQFLDYLEDAYCVQTAKIYAISEKKKLVNPQKVYAIDAGLISAYSQKPEFDQAALLETHVYLHLRRQTEEVCYYKTQQGYEVDFFIPEKRTLIQASYTLVDPSTLERETKALWAAMDECGMDKALIITYDDDPRTLSHQGKTINCRPLWHYLLYFNLT